MAHDLRTPLQSVRFLVPVLESMPVLKTGAEILDRLRAATDRALAIGQDLLQWCKTPVQGTQRRDRHWLVLEPLLLGLASEQVIAAQRKGIKLEVTLAEVQGIEAHTDAVRLGRLIGNLLSNAVRYTNTGHVRLEACWREEKDCGRTLALTVEDTGEGLSTDQDSIFQPFQRGKAGQTDDSGGSGLGLAVVDRLIHDLGLTLEVFSEHGQGSRFALLFPGEALRLASP